MLSGKLDVEIKAADKVCQQNLDLKAANVQQEHKLLQCQREIAQSQAMLAELEEQIARQKRQPSPTKVRENIEERVDFLYIGLM